MKQLFVLLLACVCAGLFAANGPIAHYPLNGDFNDASGNGNNLTPLGEARFAKDTQIRDHEIQVYGPTRPEPATNGAAGAVRGVDIRNGLTICGFFMPSGANNYSGVGFGFGEGTWGKPSYTVLFPSGQVFVKCGRNKQQVRGARLPRGMWYHVALVLPPESEGRRECNVYINGEKKLSCAAEYVTPEEKFIIGALCGKQCDGKRFAEVKVFNRALTPEEIAEEAKMTGKIVKVSGGGGGGNGTGGNIPVPRWQKPDTEVAISGDIKVRVLDAKNLALVGNYQKFLNRRFEIECGAYLKLMHSPEYKPADWSVRFNYNFAAAAVIAAYRPRIAAAYQNREAFSLVDDSGKKIGIARSGYWMNPIAVGSFTDFSKTDGSLCECKAAELVHAAYLELAEPLKTGGHYTLTNPLGEKVAFTYSDAEFTPSIKVNQVGYSDDARKYGYLGMWRGPELGALDFKDLDGKEFFVTDAKSGTRVFSGRIARRMDDVVWVNKKKPEQKGSAFTGEVVYELDFTDFKTPGEYKLQIPGVGSSWPFRIGNDAIGEAFYVRMKGMFQKRCGIGKEKPYTNWTEDICHQTVYRGKFAPNTRHYGGGKTGSGFYDAEGKRTSIGRGQFTVIQYNCTPDEVLPDMNGGWHDAGDFDRRPFHLLCVGEFLSAYLMFPQNFSDGQLNIPESGNGIPDIVDEALWGIKIWRHVQDLNPKGGVGCWIEAARHPARVVSKDDKLDYYLARPTMEGTAEYAGFASGMALVLHRLGNQPELEARYIKGAKQALEYALDPANRQEFDITIPRKDKKTKQTTETVYHYKESETFPTLGLCKAAFDLYLITKEPKYLTLFRRYGKDFDAYVRNMIWSNDNPMYFAAMWTETEGMEEFKEERSLYKKYVLQFADEWLGYLENNYPYRTLWYPKSHPYVTFMSWGNGHPMRYAMVLTVAYRITGDEKYRQGALLSSDAMLGANPTGASWTSGLGKVYPVSFLDNPSYCDGIDEFVWGITPYRNTFGIPYPGIQLGYGLFWGARNDHKFEGQKISLLPKTLYDGDPENADIGQYANVVRGGLPIWRRFVNLEGYTVASSEFTVNETLSIPAAVTGCLLRPGYMPPDELKNRQPASDAFRLEGRFALP